MISRSLFLIQFGVLAAIVAGPIVLFAQTVASTETHIPAPYTPQVWDIDWSYLAQPGSHRDWTDDLHYIPIGKSSVDFLSITGQMRERGEYQDHPNFGAQPADNGYVLQRYLFSGDLHLVNT